MEMPWEAAHGDVPCTIHHLPLLDPGHEENVFNSWSFLSLPVYLYYLIQTKLDSVPAVKGMSVSTAKDRK